MYHIYPIFASKIGIFLPYLLYSPHRGCTWEILGGKPAGGSKTRPYGVSGRSQQNGTTGGASPSPTGWMGRYSVEENRRAAFRIIFFDNQFRPAGRTPPSQNSYGGVSSFLYFHSDRSLTSTFRDRFSFLKRLKPYFFNAVLPPNRST